jgi:DNA (cytosine-5)-methyltransferase 1
VFVVGYLGDWRRAAAVLFERESLLGHSAPRREAGKGIAPTLSARTKGGGGLGTDFECDGGLIPHVARALTTSNQRIDAETETLLVAHSLRGEGFDASEDGTGRGTPLVPIAFDLQQITSSENRSTVKPGPAPTMAKQSQLHVITHAVRRLTPMECERLQGFPDSYTDVVYRGKQGADGNRYKALGNSMAVNVMRWLGERIQMVENTMMTEVA